MGLDSLDSSHSITYDFFQDRWICGFVQLFGDDVVNFFRFGQGNAGLFQLLVEWSVTSEHGSGRNFLKEKKKRGKNKQYENEGKETKENLFPAASNA